MGPCGWSPESEAVAAEASATVMVPAAMVNATADSASNSQILKS
jgi:hypothetical protein